MKLKRGWQYQSIETLEKHDYGNPATAPTALLKKCLEYVKLPVNTLSVEQLRLLIGQKIGLLYLIPLAIDELDKDVLAEGDYYPGDLLNVTIVNVAFWKDNPELYSRLKALLKKGKQKIEQHGIDTTTFPNHQSLLPYLEYIQIRFPLVNTTKKV